MRYLPTILSLTRIPLALAFLTTSFEIRLLAILLAAVSDFFDGWIARRFNLESRLGAIMDPLTDKLFVLIASCVLLLEKDFHPFFFSLFFLRDAVLIIALIVHKKLLKSAEIGSNVYGKLTTFLQFMILTSTIIGVDSLQYLSLLFPYLSFRYLGMIRQNLHLPPNSPFSFLKN
ncbi:MAG: CDP-alcohol phosphatidyltransferase family protein [Chlamydiae bacterium]|nr:CDP-alcohol phosphatidyltransferase family protein [Chlamydiota bacterium]